MILLDLGFRAVPSTGVLIRTAPFAASGAAPRMVPAFPAEAEARLAAAQGTWERLAAGWRPGEADLAGAPIIDHWAVLVVAGGVALTGRVSDHPRIRARRVAATSLLVATDGALVSWARTISRYYRLGRPAGRALSS